MAHDVFVSHSSKDKPTADAVVAMLESKGVRCWVAPRDITPGMDWGEAIVQAVKGARVMVLIFSASANDSPQIKREVERAVNKGIPVIPLRIEDVAPTASLEYFISTPHWLDAFTPPLERHLQYLAQIIQQILGAAGASTVPLADAKIAASAQMQPGTTERSQGEPVPNTWRLGFFDSTAALKVTELKFRDGKKIDTSQPFAVLERYNAGKAFDRKKLKIDSNKALQLAMEDPMLKGLTLRMSEIKLQTTDGPFWQIHLWVGRIRRPSDMADAGQIFISAEDGKVIKRDLHPPRD